MGRPYRRLAGMNLQTRIPETPTVAPARTGGRFAALREAIRTRRDARSELSREIAAYPATRSAAAVVLPGTRVGSRPAGRRPAPQSPQQLRTPKATSSDSTPGAGLPVMSRTPVSR